MIDRIPNRPLHFSQQDIIGMIFHGSGEVMAISS